MCSSAMAGVVRSVGPGRSYTSTIFNRALTSVQMWRKTLLRFVRTVTAQFISRKSRTPFCPEIRCCRVRRLIVVGDTASDGAPHRLDVG